MLFGLRHQHHAAQPPTAVLLQEDSDLSRSILKRCRNTAYFHFTREVHDVAEFDNLLLSGKVLFGVEIPRAASRAAAWSQAAAATSPALLVAADGQPIRWSRARRCRRSEVVVQTALEHDLFTARPAVAAVRDPHACALQSGRLLAAENIGGPAWSAPS